MQILVCYALLTAAALIGKSFGPPDVLSPIEAFGLAMGLAILATAAAGGLVPSSSRGFLATVAIGMGMAAVTIGGSLLEVALQDAALDKGGPATGALPEDGPDAEFLALIEMVAHGVAVASLLFIFAVLSVIHFILLHLVLWMTPPDDDKAPLAADPAAAARFAESQIRFERQIVEDHPRTRLDRLR
ncbi:MAG: hypothetical protein AAFW46_13135 [Pseudomonadota bacterium]